MDGTAERGWLRGLKRRREPAPGEASVQELAVETVLFNPYQPRQTVDEAGLRALAESIEEHGLIQPIVVRPIGPGYELVTGERRLRAFKLLGRPTIPALVRELSDQETALAALIENLQREDLDFWEEATGYQRLLDEFGLSQSELARRLGRSQAAIANKLRLLRLAREVRQLVAEAGLSERHARAVLPLEDGQVQLEILRRVASEGLSVEATERLVEARLRGQAGEIARRGRPRRKVLRVVKDVRIVLNTFRQAVDTLKKAGLPAALAERDAGEYIEVVVRLPKGRPASGGEPGRGAPEVAARAGGRTGPD